MPGLLGGGRGRVASVGDRRGPAQRLHRLGQALRGKGDGAAAWTGREQQALVHGIQGAARRED
eukprot:1719360-Alexandrium_andersonii.AAC.1